MKPTKTVWKFPISLTDRTIHEMPRVCDPLRVGMQHGQIMLWTLVVPGAEKETRKFFVTGTGHPVPMSAAYLGSVSDGPFEWHVWEDLNDHR